MTDEDIKKALECCVSDDYDESCIKCPARKYKGCDYTLHKNALDLIDRQQAEIEKFKKAIKETDQHFLKGDIAHGMDIIIKLVRELEKGSVKNA